MEVMNADLMQGISSDWRITYKINDYLTYRIEEEVNSMAGKILIVDDQFGIRILLNEVLVKKGMKRYQAANGVQALEIVK